MLRRKGAPALSDEQSQEHAERADGTATQTDPRLKRPHSTYLTWAFDEAGVAAPREDRSVHNVLSMHPRQEGASPWP